MSATSAGAVNAVNAVIVAMGLASGGRAAARAGLERFWPRISRRASGPQTALAFGTAPFGGAALMAFDLSSRVLSPYQTNPFDLNPLRDVLASEIDFDLLRRTQPLRLLISATRVADGRPHIFREGEISLDVILAATCLPLMHQAVQIDDESYWDGGYTSNPPLLPLISSTRSRDVLVVQISPQREPDLPRTSPRIVRRAAQIGFGSPLQGELTALDALAPLYRGPTALLSPLARRFHRLRLHGIAAEDAVVDLARSDPLDLDWSFLQRLRTHGHEAADRWLVGTGAAVDRNRGLRTEGHGNVMPAPSEGH